MIISEGIGKLATALAKAQGVMDDALKLNKNPHFKSSYADLAAVRAAIQKPLSENGLAYVQLLSTSNDGLDVQTMLIHGESGEFIGDTLTIPLGQQRTPQAVGSAASYGRRYGLMALIGIAAEDDDGNAAQESAQDTGKYGAISVRKSSAKAKRDGDWEKLAADMRDAQSAVSLRRLWDGYRQSEYQSWNADWRREAEELFERRMAEFSAGEGLKETLEDSLEAELPATFAPNARERAKSATTEVAPTVDQVGIYQERVRWLKGAKTPDELKERAKKPEHATEVARLTEAQVADLRAYYADRFNELQGALLSAG